MSKVKLICGECLDILPTLPEQSVDAIITDLPYGTTGVAAVKTGRNAILIEKRQDYFDIAQWRIAQAQMQPNLFEPGKTGE